MSDLNKEDNIEKKSDPAKKDEKKELTLEEKLKDTEQKLLRSLAEIDNQRKRFEKDIQDCYKVINILNETNTPNSITNIDALSYETIVLLKATFME